MSIPVERSINVWHPRFLRATRWITVAVLLAAAVSTLARSWWIADLVSNLRVQLILGLMATLITSVVARNWKLASVSGVVLLWQASWLWSAFVADSALPAGGPAMKVCTINVLSQNTQYDRIIEHLRGADPDVVAVLELSSPLQEKLIQELGARYPYRLLEPHDDGNFGIGLFSRFPLQGARMFHLSAPPVPSIQTAVEWNGGTVQLIVTHPVPPISSRFFRARNLHLNLLAKRVKSLWQNHPDEPVIVVGDLNLTPWSPVFRDFLIAADLHDASRGHGLTPTWYRWPLFPFGLVLDHGLATQDLVCTRRAVHGDVGSDHRPVTFEFTPAAK